METESKPNNIEREKPKGIDLLSLADKLIEADKQKIEEDNKQSESEKQRNIILEAIRTKKLSPSARAVEESVFLMESRVADETHQGAMLAFAKEVALAHRDTLAYVDAKFREGEWANEASMLVRAPLQQLARFFSKNGLMISFESLAIGDRTIKAGFLTDSDSNDITLNPDEVTKLTDAGLFELHSAYPTERKSYKITALPIFGYYQKQPVVLAPGRIFESE